MRENLNRGLAEENNQRSIISPIGYFKSPIGYILQLGIGDLLSDSELSDSYIPNPQLDILSPFGDLRSLIGDLRYEEEQSQGSNKRTMCSFTNFS